MSSRSTQHVHKRGEGAMATSRGVPSPERQSGQGPEDYCASWLQCRARAPHPHEHTRSVQPAPTNSTLTAEGYGREIIASSGTEKAHRV